MNFCINCQYCKEIYIECAAIEYLCKKQINTSIDYVAGESINNLKRCVQVRHELEDCPYFKQKLKWYQKIFK